MVLLTPVPAPPKIPVSNPLRDRFINLLVRTPAHGRGVSIAIILGLLAAIGAAYVLGRGAITTQGFYLLPLILAVSWLGLGWGVLVALLAAFSRIVGDLATTYYNPDYYFAAADLSRVVSNRISSLIVNLVVVLVIHELILLSRQLEKRVQDRTAALREALAGRERIQNALFEAEARERSAVGRDLHDGLGQHLTATAMAARILARRLHDRDDPLVVDARRVESLVTEGIDQTRRLARGLLLESIAPTELVGELRELVRHAAAGTTVTCNLSCQGDPTRLDSPRASHLYYIAREAFHNAQRHAAATRIDLHLTIQDHVADLVVADDGAGIDLSVPNLPGMGLSIMRNRAELIGGRFEIETAPQRGTRITCRVPFQPASSN